MVEKDCVSALFVLYLDTMKTTICFFAFWILVIVVISISKEDLAMLKPITLQTAELLDILPDEDISIVNALIKKLVIAWDPDFTKVTARERELLEKSDSEMKNSDFVSEEDFWS